MQRSSRSRLRRPGEEGEEPVAAAPLGAADEEDAGRAAGATRSATRWAFSSPAERRAVDGVVRPEPAVLDQEPGVDAARGRVRATPRGRGSSPRRAASPVRPRRRRHGRSPARSRRRRPARPQTPSRCRRGARRSRSPSSSPRRRRSPAPASTSSPVGDVDLQHRPLHRADDRVAAGAAAARTPRARAGGARARPRAARARARSRRSGGRPPRRRSTRSAQRGRSTPRRCRVAHGVSSSARAASSSDSTRPWHVSPATKHGCASSARWKPEQRRQAADLELVERAQHPPPRVLAVDAVDDQLRDHRVVEAADLGAGDDARVDAHARPGRLAIGGDPPGRGQEAAATRPRR